MIVIVIGMIVAVVVCYVICLVVFTYRAMLAVVLTYRGKYVQIGTTSITNNPTSLIVVSL